MKQKKTTGRETHKDETEKDSQEKRDTVETEED